MALRKADLPRIGETFRFLRTEGKLIQLVLFSIEVQSLLHPSTFGLSQLKIGLSFAYLHPHLPAPVWLLTTKRQKLVRSEFNGSRNSTAAVNVSVRSCTPSSPWSPQDPVSIEGDEEPTWPELSAFGRLICGDAGWSSRPRTSLRRQLKKPGDD